MIHAAMSPVLHVEGCRTRPDSIVVGHHHTDIHLRGVIVAFHLSFVLFAVFGIRTGPVLAFFQSLFYCLFCRSPPCPDPVFIFLRVRIQIRILHHCSFSFSLRQEMNWRSWLRRRASSPCSPFWRTITTASSAASSILPASTCPHASSGITMMGGRKFCCSLFFTTRRKL